MLSALSWPAVAILIAILAMTEAQFWGGDESAVFFIGLIVLFSYPFVMDAAFDYPKAEGWFMLWQSIKVWFGVGSAALLCSLMADIRYQRQHKYEDE